MPHILQHANSWTRRANILNNESRKHVYCIWGQISPKDGTEDEVTCLSFQIYSENGVGMQYGGRSGKRLFPWCEVLVLMESRLLREQSVPKSLCGVGAGPFQSFLLASGQKKSEWHQNQTPTPPPAETERTDIKSFVMMTRQLMFSM